MSVSFKNPFQISFKRNIELTEECFYLHDIIIQQLTQESKHPMGIKLSDYALVELKEQIPNIKLIIKHTGQSTGIFYQEFDGEYRFVNQEISTQNYFQISSKNLLAEYQNIQNTPNFWDTF